MNNKNVDILERKALIFNVQKYNTFDGPGVRTLVFFKGCPLHCTWCHNPETQCYNPEVEFDSEKCVGCGFCIGACHAEAISIVNGKAFTDSNKCDRCDKCEGCCDGAYPGEVWLSETHRVSCYLYDEAHRGAKQN